MTRIADIRREYTLEKLNEELVNQDPFIQFGEWFDAALKCDLLDATAMSLGTATPDGKPSVRIVLLKGFDSSGFVFYTNYDSRKGQELHLNPVAALTFYWQELQRQVRIEGKIELTSPEESDKYYNTRPLGSRLGAWASPQSQHIDRKDLESRLHELENEYKNVPPPRPPFWGGYRLVSEMIEFWQGRPNRMHDRIVYNLQGRKWNISRIAP